MSKNQTILKPNEDYSVVRKICQIIENTYENFGIQVRVMSFHLKPGLVAIELQVALGTEVKQVYDHKLELCLAFGLKEDGVSFELSPQGRPHILVTIQRPVFFEATANHEESNEKDFIHFKDPLYKAYKAINYVAESKGNESMEIKISNVFYFVRLTGSDNGQNVLIELVNNEYAQPHNVLSKKQIKYLENHGWKQDEKSELTYFQTTEIPDYKSKLSVACKIMQVLIDVWDYDLDSYLDIEIAKSEKKVNSTSRLNLNLRNLTFLAGRQLMRLSGSLAAD